MKIDANASAVQLNAYLKQVRQQQRPSDSRTDQEQTRQIAGSDKVELSQQAKEAHQAMQALKTMPDTRPEKVAQVKLEVEKGTYQVSGERVATGMLKEAFENDTILQKINTKA
jgi:flagellar biosynthesis anti-sigma factor FlgM